jgi:hypothetical protein
MTMRSVNFPTKVDLCIGLGVLEPLWREPLRRINSMRNRVAHRLTFEFTAVEKSELYQLMPKNLREHALTDAGLKPDEEDKLEWWRILRIIVVWLDVMRQRQQVGRVREKISALRLRRVLDRK